MRIFPERNQLLASLSQPAFDLLAPHMSEVALERGATLQSGASTDHIYFPRSGMVSAVMLMRDGCIVETGTIGREGLVGTFGMDGGASPRVKSVVQLPGRAGRIGATRFEAAFDAHPEIRRMVLAHYAALLGQTQQSVACNAHHDVDARLCRWLLTACDRSDSEMLPLTQEFLSQMLGVRRTTVTLVARILQNDGLIRYRRGHIEVTNRAALEARACECYAAVRRQTAEPEVMHEHQLTA